MQRSLEASGGPSGGQSALRFERRAEVSQAVGLPSPCEIALGVVLPAAFPAGQTPVALCCLPGGYLTRRYWDLEAEGDDSYSFAAFMAARGFVVLCVDHLGSGESTKPEDGYAVTLDRVVEANQCAIASVLDQLRAGRFAPGVPPLPGLVSVGVGHSMGSFLGVAQQARFESHAALALYSYSNRGLPELLSKDELEIAQDPTAVWKRLPEWVERRFGSPYPQVSRQHAGASEAAFGTGSAEGAGVAALRKCGTNLVAQPGLLTLYPGGYAPFSEDVTCPVFVATGDGDLSPRSDADGAFPNAVEVVDYLLEDSRHAHNVARTRQRLWARTARWVRSVVPGAAANESR